MQWNMLVRFTWVVIFCFISVVSCLTFFAYKGSGAVYIAFTLLSTFVLYFGFGRGAIFFDAFIGVLLWVGFWLKFSIRTAFLGGEFSIDVGRFDHEAVSIDFSLLVVSCALLAVLLARWLRYMYIFRYPKVNPSVGYVGIYHFYARYRLLAIVLFVIAVCFVCLINFWFGIYRRGLLSETFLPFGLNGVFTWLLMFGMASISALILRFEFELNKDRYWVALFLSMMEVACSNFSMWSRGMILNGSSLLYGVAVLFKKSESRVRVALCCFAFFLFSAFFLVSVVSVNAMRAYVFYGVNPDSTFSDVSSVVRVQTDELFLDRWVGIEGVMAVLGSGKLGWETFQVALVEVFDESANSFFDDEILGSTYYSNDNDGPTHFISLPGYIAFFFYPGSFCFLFFAVFIFSMFGAFIEFLTFRFGGRNLVFCALVAQIVAFRYTSFGYVPSQSYLLFGSILLNIAILYFSDKICRRFNGIAS